MPGNKKTDHKIRIIGGDWRGRRLPVPNIEGLRPTGDRIRETLFNWLMADVAGAHCLDLFAGTGALGLEALSRGAATVTFVEKHPQATKVLSANLNNLQATNGKLVNQDACRWLDDAVPKPPYDIIFLDPPFAANLWQPVLDTLAACHLLQPGGLVYIEQPKRVQVQLPDGWQQLKHKTTGQVSCSLVTSPNIESSSD